MRKQKICCIRLLCRLVVALCSLLYMSCSETSLSSMENEYTEVSFNFTIPDENDSTGTKTRAITSTNENTINEIAIYIFDKYGSVIGYGYTTSNTINVLTRKASECTVYAVANAGRLSGISSKTQFDNSYTTISSATYIANEDKLIMFGQISNYTTSSTPSTINLQHLASKFTLRFWMDSGTTLTSYQIKNAPKTCYYSTEHNETNSTLNTYIDFASVSVGKSNGMVTSSTYYIYENLSGTNTSKATYVSAVTNKGTFTIYIGGTGTITESNSSTAKSIVRNKNCTVDIILYKSNKYVNFDYTGDIQSYTVPITGKYRIECWGAQGGTDGNIAGGLGGYTSGNINLTKGRTLYVVVGQHPTGDEECYNNGIKRYGPLLPNGKRHGSAWPGGGSTDIRLIYGNGQWRNFDGIKSRIMVAAGGGGACGYWIGVPGAAAGGLKGSDGELYYDESPNAITGTGGEQTQGGRNGTVAQTDCGRNQFGYSYLTNGESLGRGGNGYYAGGNGGHGGGTVGSGAGGSSFISGHSGCNAIKEESTEGNIVHSGQANHYSNLVFESTILSSGKELMPSPSGTGEYGHSGNGYARITFISAN